MPLVDGEMRAGGTLEALGVEDIDGLFGGSGFESHGSVVAGRSAFGMRDRTPHAYLTAGLVARAERWASAEDGRKAPDRQSEREWSSGDGFYGPERATASAERFDRRRRASPAACMSEERTWEGVGW